MFNSVPSCKADAVSLFRPLKCIRYTIMCTSEGEFCDSAEIGTSKAVFGFGTQSECDMMASHPETYQNIKCCSTDGCNYVPLVGPSLEDPGVLPSPRCQFLGVKVNTVVQAIAATSNCGPKGCFNMTRSQMKQYIGSPAMVPLEPNHFSCIDGRHDNEIVATPAGDMGIFLSSAYVYINASSTPNDFSLPRIKV